MKFNLDKFTKSYMRTINYLNMHVRQCTVFTTNKKKGLKLVRKRNTAGIKDSSEDNGNEIPLVCNFTSSTSKVL